MKLGATAASPGVTARWRSNQGTLYLCARGGVVLYTKRGGGPGSVQSFGRMWLAQTGGENGIFPHRWQAKRAVEAAVSQALREAGEQ